MAQPVLLIHGYSSEGRTSKENYSRDEVRRLYGSLPARLERAGYDVQFLNLSRWISLDDGLGIDDISLALDRALRNEKPELLNGEFSAIVHSTGALVVRNWVRRHWDPRAGKCPLRRIVYLAGALIGSGWAHIGKSQLIRFGREVFQGVESGTEVLKALEFGSDWMIDLHRHFLMKGTQMHSDYGVMEFCLIGSQVPAKYVVLPIRYGKEDGSDGVVRVSAGNLNFGYLAVGPTEKGLGTTWRDASAYLKQVTSGSLMRKPGDSAFGEGFYEVKFDSEPGAKSGGTDRHSGSARPVVPFGVPYHVSHGDPATGIVSGTSSDGTMDPLVIQALSVSDEDAYRQLAADWESLTRSTRERVAEPEHESNFFAKMGRAIRNFVEEPRSQYDAHGQVVMRFRDQRGAPINDFSVYFNSMGGDGAPNQLINKLFEDRHKNDHTPNCITFYLRLDRFQGGNWVSQLDQINGVDLEIDARDPATNRVVYLPIRLRIAAHELKKWIRPNATTLVDITLMRVPSDSAFQIR